LCLFKKVSRDGQCKKKLLSGNLKPSADTNLLRAKVRRHHLDVNQFRALRLGG